MGFCVAKIDVFLSSNLIVDCSWLNFLHVVIFGLFSFGFFKGEIIINVLLFFGGGVYFTA